MTTTYECSRCGVVSETKEHLCEPKTLASRYDYCGDNPERDICDTMNESFGYECSSCGRAAENKELLCHPRKAR